MVWNNLADFGAEGWGRFYSCGDILAKGFQAGQLRE